MENFEFEKQMKKILEKASEASDMTLDWRVVSTDPDCVADFGCDYEGNLCIQGESLPFKIKDVTKIRYRWTNDHDLLDCYIRLDFEKGVHLDYCYPNDTYHVKYHDTYKFDLRLKEAIALLQQCIDSDIKQD